jgi:hypothetical protein
VNVRAEEKAGVGPDDVRLGASLPQ